MEGKRNEEISNQVDDNYNPYPLKGAYRANIINNIYEKSCGKIRLKHERGSVPKYPRLNPIIEAGKALVENPHYSVMPQWWG